MSLSDEQQDRLREIEMLTLTEDPHFASRLDLDDAVRRRRRLRWVCWWLLGLGAVLALTGAGAAQRVISSGTVVAAVGCTLMVWAALTAHGLRSRRH